MDWISDHLQLIIAIAGSVAWWLNRRKQAAAGEEAPPTEPESVFGDPELAERTRKIREEIQRKIAQRARGQANEQPILPQEKRIEPPLVREVTVPRAADEMRRSGPAYVEAQRQAEILEQQASLAERLREAERMKTAKLKQKEVEAVTAAHAAGARAQTRMAVLGDLRDPAALRRAFVLREVLGPPVALR